MRPAHTSRLARLKALSLFLSALLGCLALVPLRAEAAYDDSIVLRNGDRLRGEVKNLQQGMLQFKTDTMSTVYIKWDRVAEITAPETFEVETTDGIRLHGPLASGGRGKLVIDIGLRTVTVNLMDVVRISLLKRGFWNRIDGSVDLGASYTKSSGIGQGSLSVDVNSRRPNYEIATKFDTTITVQPDQPVSVADHAPGRVREAPEESVVRARHRQVRTQHRHRAATPRVRRRRLRPLLRADQPVASSGRPAAWWRPMRSRLTGARRTTWKPTSVRATRSSPTTGQRPRSACRSRSFRA